MKKIKAQNPQGTRDFNHLELAKRNYIFKILTETFENFGFQPLETPAFENFETFTNNYGNEGDTLIYKILKSGNYLSKTSENQLSKNVYKALLPSIVDKALRYDLTVPFARYVAQHQNELTFPFKRYQIQPVWRADRPQKGRFREFYQCDADIIGSTSLWQEVEIIQLIDLAFDRLNLTDLIIHINSRKILNSLIEIFGLFDKRTEIITLIDKKDKIGIEKVKEKIIKLNIGNEKAINEFLNLLNSTDSFENIYATLIETYNKNEFDTAEIDELKFIYDETIRLGLKSAKININLSLARGLDYYTGTIIEVMTPKSLSSGSIAGGGRYDNLIQKYTPTEMSGIGISFGLERIYLILDELKLFKENNKINSQVLFINFGVKESQKALQIIKALRNNNISCELFPDMIKLGKQISYADKRNIPFVIFVGEEEIKNDKYLIKDLKSRKQELLSADELITYFLKIKNKKNGN